MLPLRRVTSVLLFCNCTRTHPARITLDCSGQVTEQFRGGNGSISAKSRSAFKPRMEIWPDFTQPKVTPAPLLLQDITYLWPTRIRLKEETDSLLWTWFALCRLSPTKGFLQEKEDIYELCVLESKGLLPPGVVQLLGTNALAQRVSINQKSQKIQLTLRLFSKLIRPPCWKEREEIREEPDLYLEINAQKFTQVPVNNTAHCFPFLFVNRF